ncbi:MAG TPA: 30S ribosomal protein S21 [Candidatus Woesebacteria bacterium]|nr:30S ribosomal protein S21 [Candidatus Woesebacteria bacterium]
MVLVKKKKGENKDAIFKKFTKLFIEEEIVDEVRKRQYRKKPSQVRKEEEKERAKRRKKR